MKSRIIIYSTIIFFILSGCENIRDEHYGYPETVNKNVWEVMEANERISTFVELMREHQLDTLFQTDISYTVFAPSNDAIETSNIAEIDTTVIKYHMVSSFIQSESANGKRRMQTLSKKYSLFEKTGLNIKMDEIPASFESPLYRNGKFFILDQVAEPRPNLYQYYKKQNEVLTIFVDNLDSIVLDLERSKPLGFNDKGQTVFDSVTFIFNEFEEDYFPVRREFRNKAATVVFPYKEDYERALTYMAQNMGAGFTDYRDIPMLWQQEVLAPYLIEKGFFENMLEPEDFVVPSVFRKRKMKNIVGDSVVIDYIPSEKILCSNGYAYNYTDFQVPDSLYRGGVRTEFEDLMEWTGGGYAWIKGVSPKSTITMIPQKSFDNTASNDTIGQVIFPTDYNGQYDIEFRGNYVFPRKYLMVVKAHMQVGGVYDIYVNNELVRTFDFYEFELARRRGYTIFSVNGKDYYRPDKGSSFNSFDMYVENISEFSRPTIRFEYKEPGQVKTKGLAIDYISFVPVE